MQVPSTANVLALGGLFIVGLAMALLFFIDVPANNAQTLGVVLGYVSGWVSAAYAFFFGSTKSSQLKDATISAMAGTGTGTGTTTTTTDMSVSTESVTKPKETDT